MVSFGPFFPVFFLIVSILSLILGMNVILADGKSTVNRLFFLIALMLSVWSFGFTIASEAPDIQICLTWRRVAAFGWTIIFALILHFALVFSGRRFVFLQRGGYGLLYLPALICVYVFSLSDGMAVQQYKLVQMGSVWVNAQVNNGWDYLFYTYFLSYSLLTLFLLFHKYHNTTGNERQQAVILLLSFGASMLLGALTDLLNPSLQLFNIPQMAPAVFLIPISAIHFNMRRHYLMMKPDYNEQEIILSKSLRNRLFFYYFTVPFVGAFVYFFSEYYFSGKPFGVVLVPAIGFALMGISGLVLRYSSQGYRYIETMFGAAAVILIPIITAQIFLTSAGVSARALPFIFIIVSMLFNNRNLLITTSVSTLLTLAALWIMVPGADVHVGAGDYLIYGYFLIVSIWVAFFVNKTYLSRLAETVLKNRLQILISDVSGILLSINQHNKNGHFAKVLKHIGRTYRGDVAILCLNNLKSEEGARSYIWETDQKTAVGMSAEERERISPHLCTQTLVISDAVGDQGLPAGVGEMLQRMGLNSMLSIPLDFSKSFSGFLAVGTKTRRVWDDTEKDTLRILINNLSDSMVKLSAQTEIEFLAFHDHLTQLPNRLLFQERAEQAIRLAERTTQALAIIFLDMDSFKGINDSMGHKIGDGLLRTVSTRLSACLEKSDTVSRFGGDEFLILLQSANTRENINKVMDNIMNALAQPMILQGLEVFITLSAGIAVYPQDGETTDALIKNADIAMYNAKENGKNRYLFCSQEMKASVQYKAQLTNLLYRALERGEFSLVYQPQIDLHLNRIIGAEVLLRWNQHEMGAISPSVFIPLAEKAGVISAIGDWVLLEACRQLKAWQEQGLPHIRIAVNISVSQLRNPTFVERVKEILQSTGVEPWYLELEVTESTAIKEPAYIVDLLNRLKTLGVYLSIDDFGTEYSSLNRLKQLPVDRIKMDMQFVQGIDKNEKDRAISKVIINLAKSLGLRVIAEGVENVDQLDFLNQKMCDEVQGFIYYRPLPPGEMEQVLRNGLEFRNTLNDPA